jgi:cytidylate kinase
MTDKQAYELIGERAAELAAHPEIRKLMLEKIRAGQTKEEVEKWLYMVAIGTLYGRAKK